jgi:D-alanyl-lipoteichoic acid acyltransferase DltB (MBOAT superfamily)
MEPPVPGSMVAAATAPFRLAQVYLAFTGLADLQIGLMRQLGYVIPERYDHVLRARSPRDFWRRWNTYVGAWARLYVFQPLAAVVSKRLASNAVAKKLAHGTILFITFAVVGALHDAYATASSMRLLTSTTQWFCINALVMFAWDVLSSVLKTRPPRRALLHNGVARLGVLALAMVFVSWFP